MGHPVVGRRSGVLDAGVPVVPVAGPAPDRPPVSAPDPAAPAALGAGVPVVADRLREELHELGPPFEVALGPLGQFAGVLHGAVLKSKKPELGSSIAT